MDLSLPIAVRIALGVVTAVAGILAAILAQALWPNVVYRITRRGNVPNKRPLRLWATFIASVVCVVLGGVVLTETSSTRVQGSVSVEVSDQGPAAVARLQPCATTDGWIRLPFTVAEEFLVNNTRATDTSIIHFDRNWTTQVLPGETGIRVTTWYGAFESRDSYMDWLGRSFDAISVNPRVVIDHIYFSERNIPVPAGLSTSIMTWRTLAFEVPPGIALPDAISAIDTARVYGRIHIQITEKDLYADIEFSDAHLSSEWLGAPSAENIPSCNEPHYEASPPP